jgi:hypothetical protein
MQEADDLSRDEIGELVGEPLIGATPFPSSPSRPGPAPLDPSGMEVVDVGGLYVPKRVIDGGGRAGLIEKAHGLVDLIKENLGQLSALIEEPRSEDSRPRSRPLRDIDNSFRHGFRVLFHSATPNERRFRALSGDSAAIESHALDVYMPPRGKGESIQYGTLGCSPARTDEHLESLRQVCLRTGQFVRGFVGARCNGDAHLLLAALHLTLGNAGIE